MKAVLASAFVAAFLLGAVAGPMGLAAPTQNLLDGNAASALIVETLTNG